MRFITNVFRVLSWICYIVILIFGLVELPILFGYNPEIVLTGSMTPTYPVDSIIYYKSANFDDIQVGDTITFDLNQSIVTHRVVEKNSQDMCFITKGDANPSNDNDVVSYNQVRGKVANFKIMYLGKLVIVLQSNYFILLGMAIILIIYYVLAHIQSKINPIVNKDCNSNLVE